MNSVVITALLCICIISTTTGLQCHCSSNNVENKETFYKDCTYSGGVFVRACEEGLVCVKSEGTLKSGKVLKYQGCAPKPGYLSSGSVCTPLSMQTESGDWVKGIDCYCTTDMCNSDNFKSDNSSSDNSDDSIKANSDYSNPKTIWKSEQDHSKHSNSTDTLHGWAPFSLFWLIICIFLTMFYNFGV